MSKEVVHNYMYLMKFIPVACICVPLVQKIERRLQMPEATFCRHVDMFCRVVSVEVSRNVNVEMYERDGFRTFPHGVTSYVMNDKRHDGGWHVSIARHFSLFLCTTSLLSNATKKLFRTAYNLLLKVHAALRVPLAKRLVPHYQIDINELLRIMRTIFAFYTDNTSKAMKNHLPYHWLQTRIQLGCSASEKSLERKLGEAQKKYFPLTNGKQGVQVIVEH